MKIIWQGDYIALCEDRKGNCISVSDGVGFIGTEGDLEGLYLALKYLLKKEE